MLVDGEKYEPVNKDGNSTFEIPVSVFDAEMEVTADTVAMSEPHEIDYTLNFDSTTAKESRKNSKIITYKQRNNYEDENIIKKQQKTIFIGFMSVALFIICICTVCTAYAADKDNAKTPVDIPGLTYDHSMELPTQKNSA